MMTKFRKRLQGSAGFTLVELIVVIAVLGILAGIAIPRITGVRDKAEISAVKSDLRNIQSGLEMYFAETDNTSFTDLSDISGYVSNLDLTDSDLNYVDQSKSSYEITTTVGSYTVTLTPGGITDNK